ncbi:MAG: hypothetical protein IPJ19_14810 [Planctomycetes bacterium]|nr:hypothetical protein [Planctomycetota bacterium]
MAPLLQTGLCAALALLPFVQSGGKERGRDKKKEPVATRLEFATGKLAQARQTARERNQGLLIHILLVDMEKENVEYRQKFLADPAVIAACDRVLVLVSDNGKHASTSVEETVDGKKEKREACSIYPAYSTCAQHQQNFNDLALEYRSEDGSLHCPQTILLAPDGSLVKRIDISGVGEPAELLAGLEELRAKFGPGLGEAEWIEVSRALEEARAAQAAKSWATALRKWSRIREITPLSAYGAEAEKALPASRKGLDEELERTAAELVPGKAAAAWKKLAQLQRACAGLEVEKEIELRLKKAERRKDIAEEIAAVKLEAEAEALLASAQELADAKKEKELERVVRKLLGKRYAATPAAERARALWPEWAPAEEKQGGK